MSTSMHRGLIGLTSTKHGGCLSTKTHGMGTSLIMHANRFHMMLPHAGMKRRRGHGLEETLTNSGQEPWHSAVGGSMPKRRMTLRFLR